MCVTGANGGAVHHQPGEDEPCSGADEAEGHLGAVTPELDLQEVERFRCVYYFKSQTLPAMRRELSTFVKEFSQLYGDTLEEVLGRMDYCLKWCNAHNLRSVPFLNWTPQFGGLVQQYQPNAQIAYMHEHRIPFYMTGVIPQ